MDVAELLKHLLPILKSSSESDIPKLKKVVDAYQGEMISRSAPAVMMSRQACLDAHDYKSINDNSPLISRRVVQQRDK
jgi:hypothetical protein